MLLFRRGMTTAGATAGKAAGRWTAALVFLLVMAAISPATAATPATPENVAAIGADLDSAFAKMSATIQSSQHESAKAKKAVGEFAGAVSSARDRFASFEFSDSDVPYRDITLTAYDGIVQDARLAERGKIPIADFGSRYVARAGFVAGQIDQLSRNKGSGKSWYSFIDGWPTPLNKWWFWLLVIFGPVGPIVFSIVGGAGYGISALWNRLRRS